MENFSSRHKEALALVDQLIALKPDKGTLRYANKLRQRLHLPMSVVLAKLYPGLTVIEKAERLGITRQSYYDWIRGVSRPNLKVAKRIATLTGHTVADIRGKPK